MYRGVRTSLEKVETCVDGFYTQVQFRLTRNSFIKIPNICEDPGPPAARARDSRGGA